MKIVYNCPRLFWYKRACSEQGNRMSRRRHHGLWLMSVIMATIRNVEQPYTLDTYDGLIETNQRANDKTLSCYLWGSCTVISSRLNQASRRPGLFSRLFNLSRRLIVICPHTRKSTWTRHLAIVSRQIQLPYERKAWNSKILLVSNRVWFSVHAIDMWTIYVRVANG